MRTFPFIFVPLQGYNSSIPILYEDSHPYSPHSHLSSPYFHPDSPHSHHSPHYSVPRFPIPAFTDSQDFINRNFVFSILATLYRIGNIFINILQLCVFALDTQYCLNKVCVVSLLVFNEKLPLSL